MIDKIDALLPQTQCGECGFAGCRPYAEALARKAAPINLCPPGGLETLRALAEILQIDAAIPQQNFQSRAPATAVIKESECIGCTKCIQACPVDAIIGSAGVMHSIVADECTGCGLCVEPCPVDCIEILPLSEPKYDRTQARQRYQARTVRKLRLEHEKQQTYRDKKFARNNAEQQQNNKIKQDYILQALQRVQTKKSS